MPTHLQVHDVLLCCKQLPADAESHVCVCVSLKKLFRSWTAEAGFVPFVVQNGWFAARLGLGRCVATAHRNCWLLRGVFRRDA